MTPLEIAAKSRWESRAEDSFPHRWEDFTEEGRKAHMQDIRAALLALAETELPEPVAHAGHHAISGEDAPGYWQSKAVECFRAMCRAIAESK